jgi:Asp-tRNA(Asn)/Glu-tRNA(Gln) amidotransferase A subunit family amidase
VPTTGWSSTPPGADSIVTVIGPLSRELAGIELFMRTVLAAKPWLVEPALVPMPWTPVAIAPARERPLRIGVMYDDGVVLPHPPVVRALRELVRAIAARTADVVVAEFPAYKHDEGWAITSSLYFTDGGAADEEVIALSGEPWRPLTRWIIKENPCVKDLSRGELEYWNEEREEFRLEYANHWNSTGSWSDEDQGWVDVVDVVICPVAPWIAAKHGTSKYWGYTSTWNILDYPALAFPTPTGLCASKDIDVKYPRSSFFCAVDKEIWQNCEYVRMLTSV